MYDVQLCTYVVHSRYIPVTSDLRMRNRHVEVAYCPRSPMAEIGCNRFRTLRARPHKYDDTTVCLIVILR